MNIAIGETIAKIRKEKALTQEQLSEVFGVSVAAVSKWETGTAHPDIELLPVIADFFDISVDRLLGYDMSKTEATIDECLKKANDLLYEQKGKEALAILSNLAYKYPNNVKILVKYAKIKYQSVHGNPKNENHRKLFKEAEDILLSINKNGITRKEHDLIMDALYGLYLWDKKFDKAEKILDELKPADNFEPIANKEFWFYEHMGNREKAREKYYSILENALSSNNPLIYGHYHLYYDSPEKVIELNDKLIKAIEIFAEDFPTNPESAISVLRESNAFMYSRLGKKDEALAVIEKMIDIAAKKGESYESWMESFMKLANCGERDEYDLIKNSDEFKKITEKLKQI